MTQLLTSVQDESFPKGFLQLHSKNGLTDGIESSVLLLHSLMLEVGFIPKDVDETDVYKSMPENWKENDVFNISYRHKTIPDIFCRVTYVPLYNNLAIHGLLEDEDSEIKKVYLTTKVLDRENADPSSLLPHIKKLSIQFKDGFCFPLLVLLQERVNFQPPFGLGGLLSDIKFIILEYLPVESVISMSLVNKDFHDQANSPYLWKCLFSRDYGLGILENPDTNKNDWKEKYKEEFEKRKKRRNHLPRFWPYLLVPSLRPVPVDFHPPYADFRMDIDPALQQEFPQLRGRFQHSYLFAPSRHNYLNPWTYQL